MKRTNLEIMTTRAIEEQQQKLQHQEQPEQFQAPTAPVVRSEKRRLAVGCLQKCPKYKVCIGQNRWQPPLQPKPLDRIGAEILGIFMLILGPLEGLKIPLNGLKWP